jgi:hypothetical protein
LQGEHGVRRRRQVFRLCGGGARRIDNGFNLQADPANCGACGNRCFFANGIASCGAGQCGLAGCAAGFANLNGEATDGCEYKCPVVPPAAGDVCGNRADDDCDGEVDEGCPVFDSGAPSAGGAPSDGGGPGDGDGPSDGGGPRPPAPPTVRLELQSNAPDMNSRAQSLSCGRQDGASMAFRVVCQQAPDNSFPFAQCIAQPSSTGLFDMDAFDADNGGQGLLEVRFCLRSLDGGPISGGFNLWYGEYPRRKVIKLLTDAERQGIAAGCYVRTFAPEDADCSRFLVDTTETVVLEQIPRACRFETEIEARDWQFGGRWTSRGPDCKFSYRNKSLWITAEACTRDVNAEIYRLGVTYFPDALKCASASGCGFSDRPKCAPASDAPMCNEAQFYCAGLCQADCEGAGTACEVRTSTGGVCMSTVECLNGRPVCPLSGCSAPP